MWRGAKKVGANVPILEIWLGANFFDTLGANVVGANVPFSAGANVIGANVWGQTFRGKRLGANVLIFRGKSL